MSGKTLRVMVEDSGFSKAVMYPPDSNTRLRLRGDGQLIDLTPHQDESKVFVTVYDLERQKSIVVRDGVPKVAAYPLAFELFAQMGSTKHRFTKPRPEHRVLEHPQQDHNQDYIIISGLSNLKDVSQSFYRETLTINLFDLGTYQLPSIVIFDLDELFPDAEW